eukprot:2552556-Amphidinium_carterae.1
MQWKRNPGNLVLVQGQAPASSKRSRSELGYTWAKRARANATFVVPVQPSLVEDVLWGLGYLQPNEQLTSSVLHVFCAVNRKYLKTMKLPEELDKQDLHDLFSAQNTRQLWGRSQLDTGVVNELVSAGLLQRRDTKKGQVKLAIWQYLWQRRLVQSKGEPSKTWVEKVSYAEAVFIMLRLLSRSNPASRANDDVSRMLMKLNTGG